VAAIEKRLLRNGFVLRYDTASSEDGLSAGEGAFLACSFWPADAYLMPGRRRDATKLLELLMSLRNDVGLLSEEYDPVASRLVGNLPQALSHIRWSTVSTTWSSRRSRPSSVPVIRWAERHRYGSPMFISRPAACSADERRVDPSARPYRRSQSASLDA
jgi:hypothetical protein